MRQTIKNYVKILKIRNILVLTLTTFFYSLAFYQVVTTLFLRERGLGYTEIFLLESIISATVFVFEVPSGILADKLGKKKLIIFSIICFTASSYVMSLSYNFIAFALQSALFGIGIASLSGADSAMIYESLKEENQEDLIDNAYSLINSARTIAMVISLPIGGLLAQQFLSLPVLITCLTSTVAVIIVFFLDNEKAHRVDECKKTVRFSGHIRFVIKENPKLLILQIFNSISFSVILSLHYLNQPLFEAYGIDIKYFGIIMLVVYVMGTGITLITPILKKSLGYKRIFFLVNGICGLLLIFIWKTSFILFGVIALMLCISISSIKDTIFQSFLNINIDKEERATILSIISFFGSVVGMAIKPLIGSIVNLDLRISFLLLGISLIFVSIGMYITVHLMLKGNKKRLLMISSTNKINI